MSEETGQNTGTSGSFKLTTVIIACAVALAVGLGVGISINKGSSSTAGTQQTSAATSEPVAEETEGSTSSEADDTWVGEFEKYIKDAGVGDKELYKPSNTAVDEWLRILVNRSDLENIKLEDGPIYVIGHKQPDADTVCSAIALANLLTQLGFDAQPAITDDVNRETVYILESAGVETPQILENAAGKNIWLVDHSEYAQAVDGLDEANVVGIMDHHNTGSVQTYNAVVYDARPTGSTSDIVWRSYMNYGVDVDKQTAMLMLGASLSDTKLLQMDTATLTDYLAVASLADIAEIEDVQAYYDDMSRARLSLEGMTDREIYENDLREYEYNGKKYCIGVVEVFDEEEAAPLVERMKAEMEAEKQELGCDYMYTQVSALHDDVTFTYLVPVDEASRELADVTFGEEPNCTWDGTSFVFKPGCGRKSYLVPKLNETLDKDPTLANAA